MSSNAVLENVRRYRAVASLYRQTAAFRPTQRHSLLAEAERWDHLAASARQQGIAATVVDGVIAATALEQSLTLVTRDVKDFAGFGVVLLNPCDAP